MRNVSSMRSLILLAMSASIAAGVVLFGATLLLRPEPEVVAVPVRSAAGLAAFAPTEPPRPVPEVTFTTAAGDPRSLDDFRGQVVLLNLWATWCAPCVEEMPALDRLQARLGGPDFQVVAVSSDRGGAEVVEPFFRKQGLTALPVYLDPDNRVARALGVHALPTTVLIDRAGREVGRLQGAAAWDSPEALELLRPYLASPSPSG